MRSLFLIVALGLSLSAAAQSGNPPSDAAASVETPALSWSLLPIVFSSPDTDWAFGVLPQIVFRRPGAERQSRALLEAYYTLENQYALAVRTSFWLNQDRDNGNFEVVHKYWPTNFYGLSATDANVDGVSYIERVTTLSLSANRRYGEQLRLGLKAGFQHIDLKPGEENSLEDLGSVKGHAGGWILHAGPTIGIDTRDHVFYPAAGWLASLSVTMNGYVFGGDYDFWNARLDVRKYLQLSGRHVFAGQVLMDILTQDAPFWAMKGVGSTIRGYSSARFLDKNLVAFQIEYRVVPLFWRIGFAVFAGVGTVGRRLADLPNGTFHFAAGAGIRVAFMRDAKINIRWDFGFGADSSGDYLDMPEAF